MFLEDTANLIRTFLCQGLTVVIKMLFHCCRDTAAIFESWITERSSDNCLLYPYHRLHTPTFKRNCKKCNGIYWVVGLIDEALQRSLLADTSLTFYDTVSKSLFSKITENKTKVINCKHDSNCETFNFFKQSVQCNVLNFKVSDNNHMCYHCFVVLMIRKTVV